MVPAGARELKLNSEIGVWLPLDMAKQAQLDVELELKLDVRQERVDHCKEALARADASRDHAVEAAKKMDEVVQDLENKDEAWHRQPGVWFGAGVVATVLLEIAAVALLGAI